jgi:hypothetical protein
MYARVAAFEGGESSRIDELIGIIRDRASSGQDLPSAKRYLMLVNRQAGTALGITFFDSEEAIREAEPVFERMAAEIPEELRGRRTSLGIYEVAIEDVAEGAKAARVSSLEGSPDGADEGIRHIEENILPKARDISGWRGIITLVDRFSGKAKTITFWDAEESLRGSEALADQLRAEAADAGGDTITGVERFEVAIHEVPVAA